MVNAEASQARAPEQLHGQRLLRRVLWPIIGALLVYMLLLLYGDAPMVLESLRLLPPVAGVLGVSLAVTSLAMRALRWQLYLSAADISVPLLDSLLIFTSGLGMSITPGKVGELLKSLLLKESFDIPIARSAPVIFAERLMDLVALVLLGGVSLGYEKSPALSLALGFSALLAFFAFGRSHELGRLLVRGVSHVPVLKRHAEKVKSAHASLMQLWSFPVFSLALVLSFASWGIQAFTVGVFVKAVAGVPFSAGDSFIAYSAPLLAGTLALVPGGLGLTEASMAGTLRALSGASPSASVAVTILTRAATFWTAILLGFIALAVWRFVHRPPRLEAQP